MDQPTAPSPPTPAGPGSSRAGRGGPGPPSTAGRPTWANWIGVIRVDGLDELQDTAALLARARPPRADGVVVCSISGGTGAHVADLAAAAGLRLPVLSEARQAELHQWIPEYLSVADPVDNGGHPVGDWRGRKIIDAILGGPEVGVLICPVTGPFPPLSDKLVQDLVDAAEHTPRVGPRASPPVRPAPSRSPSSS